MESVLQLREDGPGQLPLILECGLCLVAEHGDLDAVRALIRQKQGQVGVQPSVRLGEAQRAVFLLAEIHAVSFEGAGGGVKRQRLIHGAHLLEYVAVAVLDHLSNGFRRRGDAGRALPHEHAGGLQSLALQVVGLVGAFAHFDAHHVVFLYRILDEHGHIRHDGIPDAVGDPGVIDVHVLQPDRVAVVVDAHVDDASVRIGESDDFLI